MPREYEAIRDSLEARGAKPKRAKSEAAAIYNSRHRGGPYVSGHSDRGKSHPGEKLKGKHGY